MLKISETARPVATPGITVSLILPDIVKRFMITHAKDKKLDGYWMLDTGCLILDTGYWIPMPNA
jgi:hypothetical protein